MRLLFRANHQFRFLLMPLWLLAGLHCKDRGVEPAPERVTLTLIDVAVTEAYLHIAVTNSASNETLALQRDGRTVMTFPAVADTCIADTALTQTTAYQYTARLVANNEVTGTSNTISAQTLAPSSRTFTWQTFLLGDGNSSALYDVALINDTLAYAVGEIYLSGDPLPYNLVKWNGLQWELKRVSYIFRGNLVTVPMRGISAFSPTDIWLASGDAVRGDGLTWTGYDVRSIIGDQGISLYRCWGGAANEMYFVGPLGSIVSYLNGTWQRVESGTTTSILDAWGVLNAISGQTEVYCAVSSFFEPNAERKILKIANRMSVDSLPWIGRLLTGVWTHAGYPLYTSGDGVFENRSGQWREIPTGIYTNDIRGTALNNIVAVGDFGYITHCNGLDWQTVSYDPEGGYATVRLRENLVIAVGRKSARGLVTIGRRN